jgi:hypothetical protein
MIKISNQSPSRIRMEPSKALADITLFSKERYAMQDRPGRSEWNTGEFQLDAPPDFRMIRVDGTEMGAITVMRTIYSRLSMCMCACRRIFFARV